MALLDYLNTHFYSEDALLTKSDTSPRSLRDWQTQGVMPYPAYSVRINTNCTSYFGNHLETVTCNYYAKDNVSWLALLARTADNSCIKGTFTRRYLDELDRLAVLGFHVDHSTTHDKLKQEWKHFLDGTYGLCTRTGSPENIAAKELAISIIEHYIRLESLTETERHHLTKAVDLLDQSSALFAPHERPKSSRKRLVDQVRDQYQLNKTIDGAN